MHRRPRKTHRLGLVVRRDTTLYVVRYDGSAPLWSSVCLFLTSSLSVAPVNQVQSVSAVRKQRVARSSKI
ncbi:hypothetical protein IscW_ISCW002972 [Ixodes scapularis]|uniref:Uncharacterized protein n=1 Tax=Ixodes scapularis TaxID=6945 RepID=B7P8F9_IXOSC|nr:hypothetical protein IscW_ISCW002972 [Ixodes scapularis]|eukprot:XP_002401926.1 hypothetical protein IscW_ISCW002972 [Ixodes scapularis]